MRQYLILIGIVISAGALAPARVFGGGEEAVVVFNSRLPESQALAEYYAGKRQVPKDQVLGFALSTGEEMSRAEFRDALQRPLSKKLEAARLWRIGTTEVTEIGRAHV